jgi:nucleotide-binding universal stress UspA family protein
MTTAPPTTLLAALSGGPETGVVLKTAIGLATLLGMEVEAVHVSDEGQATQDLNIATSTAGVPLHEWPGPIGDRLLEVLELPQVFGTVMGMRTFISGPRPAGHTALQVLRGTSKPLVLVPPEAAMAEIFTPRRLLVPLDGSPQASKAFVDIEGHIQDDTNVEVVILYTLNGLTPHMIDHPYYDLPIWGEDFLRRYCPGENRSFQWSTGNPASAVIDVSTELDSDLIVLSFAGDIEVGHGAVIREVIGRSSVPVIIVPAPITPAVCSDQAARALVTGSSQ